VPLSKLASNGTERRAELQPVRPKLTINRLTPVSELPSMLRVQEAAAWCDVSAGAIYSAIKDGTIKSVAFGRILRVPRTELEAWMSGNGQGR
jgi:excisionase family DNA binding protein